MQNNNKISFGAFVDAAHSLYTAMFWHQAFIGFLLYLFFAILFAFGIWFNFHIILSNIPYFVQNSIIGSIFLIIMVFLFALFLLLTLKNAVAYTNIILCGCNKNFAFFANVKWVFLSLLKASLKILSLSVAQFILSLPFVGLISSIFILDAITDVNIIIYFLLFLVFLVIKILNLFSLQICISEKRYFFAPIFLSIKKSAKKDFLRLFSISMLYTIINIIIFFVCFTILYLLFLEQPNNIIDIASNPVGSIVFAVIAYGIVEIFGTKLQFLVLALYTKPPSTLAKLSSRTAAALMDLVVCGILYVFGFWVISSIYFTNFSINNLSIQSIVVTVFTFFLVYTIYNIYFETFEGGKTFGKTLMGLIVLSKLGIKLNILQSITRNLFRILDIFTGAIIMLAHKENLRLGDILSQTFVERIENMELLGINDYDEKIRN